MRYLGWVIVIIAGFILLDNWRRQNNADAEFTRVIEEKAWEAKACLDEDPPDILGARNALSRLPSRGISD